ncbi:MAG TPA: biotin--[acetyl-CoA-carboxylase] ligase [Pseudolysinimonas sp.]|jgi:BirA family biotin operon repressor/biotin-[acetyl-CoA-carboxylase] ligase
MEPQLDRSRAVVPHLLVRDASGSTNSELTAMAADPGLPSFTVLVTTDQTAGRGRLDRAWVAPAGTALAISVLVRAGALSGEAIEAGALGWLPLVAGAAMSDAVAEVLPPGAAAGVKWPNDVQLDGRKVCGILSELVPATPSAGLSVVVGAGLNTTMTAEQLPVPTATSLVLAGADPAELDDRVLSAYLSRFTTWVTGLLEHGGDAERSGLRAAVVARCTTIGRAVRVELPGGAELHGTAVGIDALGRLEVRDGSGRVQPVAAGDIIHLR